MGNRQNKHKLKRVISLPEQQFNGINSTSHSLTSKIVTTSTSLPLLTRRPLSTNSKSESNFSFNNGGGHLGVLSRLWRGSRRHVSQSTLDNPLEQSKTTWPVPHIESLFLPEFPIKGQVDENDFQILGIIGRGAFGNVLKCKKVDSDSDNGRLYAMKVLRKAQIVLEGAVNQCKDEVTVQMSVSHPFIVDTYHHWQSKKSLYIVMDFVPCGEMFTVWRLQGAFSEDFVLLIITQVALALGYLHKIGVIYRDLKMENILLDASGNIKLIDFGLAKWLKKGNRTRTICGTLQYMAPELLLNQPYSHSSDWWSLGILMYALLTGEFPVYGAEDHHQMADQVASCRFLLPDSINENARDAVSGLLSKDPGYRIRSVDELLMEPFFRDVSIDAVLDKEVSPKGLMPAEAKLLLEENAKFADAADFVDNHFENFEWSASVQSLPAIYV